MSGIFASGLTPIVATALLRVNGGEPWLVAVYVMLSALLSVVSARAIEKRGSLTGVAARAM